jgi:predicted dienelactone hydrolase
MWVALAGAGIAGVCAVLVVFAVRALTLPPPNGPYPIGTTLLTGVGLPAPGIQVWYPARSTSGARAAYRLSGKAGFLDVSRYVRVGSLADVEPARGPFPLLIYVPGWHGAKMENTTLAQDLASNGFIVAALDDLYPDPPMDFSSEGRARATIRWANEKVERLTGAARQAIDAMTLQGATEPSARFARYIDTERIGAFGFSFGGAVAAETALRDARVRAVVDLDGWLFGEAATKGVAVPFLILGGNSGPETGSTPEARFDDLNEREMFDALRRNGGYTVAVDGTRHYDFTDQALLPSIRRRALGPIAGSRVHRIVSTYVVAFFARYLKGGEAQLPHELDPAARLVEFRKSADPPNILRKQ